MSIPRVTQILSRFNDYSQIPSYILDKAAERGNIVHSLCEGIARGEWITNSMIDPKYQGYIESFRQWQEAQVKEFHILEERLFDEAMGFSGQVDLVVSGTDNKLYLCDLKTTAKSHKTHIIQLAAYQHLLALRGIEVEASMIIYLSKKGDFPEVHRFEDLEYEWEVFMSAFECFSYFNKEVDNGDKEHTSTNTRCDE